MFITLFEIVWEMTRTANLFDIRRRYDVAVDFTEWYFYRNRGTSKFYKFAIINIV
jgi:hypothetical protein